MHSLVYNCPVALNTVFAGFLKISVAETRARIFKLLRRPGIDYKESITPAYVASGESLR